MQGDICISNIPHFYIKLITFLKSSKGSSTCPGKYVVLLLVEFGLYLL